METIDKLRLMAEQMHLEPAEETPIVTPPAARRPASIPLMPPGYTKPPACHTPDKKQQLGVFHASMSGGKTIPLLKTMLTTACERDCYYCPFRAGRNYRRESFKPAEMAQATMDMVNAGMIKGLFLSSGIIKGGATTQDKLLDTVEILRRRHHFQGYVHLKFMPGAERAQLEAAMRLADRVSINLEAPNSRRLAMLAPKKQFLEELLQPLQWAEEIRRTMPPPAAGPAAHRWEQRWASTVTQFVVGAVGESDLELLATVQHLYEKLQLSRTYFSTFHPIENTPLEHLPAESREREFRLYQSSFLLRDYGFEMEEMPFDQAGNLPRDVDPKLAWARANLIDEPVELNRAAPGELLRVPGIGPKGADAIVAARRRGTLREVADLRAIGVVASRLHPFVLLDGRRPAYQPTLFST